MSIHIQMSRNSGLQKEFTKSLSKFKYRTKRDHNLIILSCYIDFRALFKLIDSVNNEVRLKKVSLAFEFFEAFRGRQPNETVNELKKMVKWCNERNIIFKSYSIRLGALMHAKGYAVFQEVSDKIVDGIICVGSGNATLPGLGTIKNPNIELAYISKETADAISFFDKWNELIKDNKSLDKASEQADDYEFAYSLLASGKFLHEWQDNFRSQVGITYTLTPDGKKAILVDEELKQFGFDVEQATINRNPLENIDFSFSRALPNNFARLYTIDTLIGRWCPLTVWSTIDKILESDTNFEQFRESFLLATQPEKLKIAASKESDVAEQLVKRGVVINVPDRIERWKNKIENLRDNEGKLKRIFLKFDSFDLPYDFSSKDNVLELYDSLNESISIKSNRSFIAKKIEKAKDANNLTLLKLSKEEKSKLKRRLLPV